MPDWAGWRAFEGRCLHQGAQLGEARSTAARDGVSLVVFSGDLDKAMASLTIANGALAMGSKVTVFFTFWRLNLLRKPDRPSPSKALIDAPSASCCRGDPQRQPPLGAGGVATFLEAARQSGTTLFV